MARAWYIAIAWTAKYKEIWSLIESQPQPVSQPNVKLMHIDIEYCLVGYGGQVVAVFTS